MKKICYLLMVLLFMSCAKDETPRVGDIIFNSPNNLSANMIEGATNSPITNCGILVKKKDGNFYVLHILDRPILVPLETFINNGKKNQYCIMRASNKELTIDYAKYMTCSKDFRLSMGGTSYYNSELIYRIYKEDLGIELCELRPISDYNIKGLEGMLMQRGIKPNQPVVSPVDIFKSPKLKVVRNTYPPEYL